MSSKGYTQINVKEALKTMIWWIKEKDRRYQKEKQMREKLFGPLIKRLKIK